MLNFKIKKDKDIERQLNQFFNKVQKANIIKEINKRRYFRSKRDIKIEREKEMIKRRKKK